MIKYFFTKQFVGFLLVGGISALLHWIARLLLSIWLPFSFAVIIAYFIGMLIAFLLNSFFIFPQSSKTRYSQIRSFFLVNLSFLPLVWLASIEINNLLKILGIINYSEEIAHAFAISLPMLATFLIYKFFTFKEKSYG